MTSRGTAERKLQTPPNLEPASSLEIATGAYSKQNMRRLDYTHCSTLYKDKIPVTHAWYNFHSHSLRDLILVPILRASTPAVLYVPCWLDSGTWKRQQPERVAGRQRTHLETACEGQHQKEFANSFWPHRNTPLRLYGSVTGYMIKSCSHACLVRAPARTRHIAWTPSCQVDTSRVGHVTRPSLGRAGGSPRGPRGRRFDPLPRHSLSVLQPCVVCVARPREYGPLSSEVHLRFPRLPTHARSPL